MNPIRSLRFISVIVTCTLGSVSLLAPDPALAENALFRIQRRWHGAPFPPVGESTPPYTTPTWTVAGRSISPLRPWQGWTKLHYTDMGNDVTLYMDRITQATMLEQAGKAVVESGNPVGGAFTLPSGWMQYQGTNTFFPSTAWTGYLTQVYYDYQNLEGRFGPDHPNGATGSAKQTYTFHDRYPLISTTTMGKKVYTTTHGGNMGFSRNGKIKITPGTNNFGGTMRYLNHPTNASWYQYKTVGAPLFFKGYFTSQCTRMGNLCSTKSYETEVGEVNHNAKGILKLLEDDVVTNTVTPTPRFGKTQYRPLRSPPVSSTIYYFNMIAPWTTGTVSVTNMTGQVSPFGAQARGVGTDRLPTAGEVDTTLTRTFTGVSYKGKYGTYYPTRKYYSTLKGVTRIVSLVKPRLVHAYTIPRLETDPIFIQWQANKIWLLDVYFLPEPGAMLMIGSGIVAIAGLAFFRRR